MKARTHLYASFVLSLVLFANIFVVANSATLFFFDYAILRATPYYLYTGNAVMFLVLIIVASQQRYITFINEIRSLTEAENKKLAAIAKVYVGLSLLALIPFVV